MWVNNETNEKKKSDFGTSICSVIGAYWKMISYESWKRMDTEAVELFSSNFLSYFIQGSWRKAQVSMKTMSIIY